MYQLLSSRHPRWAYSIGLSDDANIALSVLKERMSSGLCGDKISEFNARNSSLSYTASQALAHRERAQSRDLAKQVMAASRKAAAAASTLVESDVCRQMRQLREKGRATSACANEETALAYVCRGSTTSMYTV